MSAREIKDLAIAREALSRISGADSESQAMRLVGIMDNMILELEKEQRDKILNRTQTTVHNDDEIPF